jgi:bacteriocin biosynthesis cyclodehydratase domain-containing protein
VEVFPSSDGSLYLLRPAAEDVMIRDAPVGARRLLTGLDGARTCEQLATEFADPGSDVRVDEVLGQLWDLGVLEDASRDADCGLRAEERTRYDRQLVYLGELSPPGVHPEELQVRLATARVTIVGLGGLGCWTAYALACAGLGELVVVDGDRVEATNLNRQVLYTPADVGLPKAAVGARTLRSFNPLIEVEPVARRLEDEADVAEVARSSQAIVELADWPVGKLSTWIARASVRLGVPHLQASQDPPLVRVGPTFLPGATGCAECVAATHRDRYPLYDEVTAFRAGRAEEAATFGPACAIVGGLIANEVVNLVLGLGMPATAGRAATLDLRTLSWEWDAPVERRADCPACG